MNKKTAIHLDLWSTTWGNADMFTAPELIRLCLRGNVTDHPVCHADTVRTSPIVMAEGRYVQTQTGTVYKLGRIHPKFRNFLRTKRPNWDWRNPITMLHSGSQV